MKILTLSLIMFCVLGNAQDKRFTLSARTELADKNTHTEVFDYGFNIGVEIEYQMNLLFFNAEVYYFPDLNGIDYTHFQGTVLGINYHSRFDEWRVYASFIRPGFIIREGGPHALFGQDIGVEWYFNEKNYIGIKTGYDIKAESKVWGDDSSHDVWYVSIKFGFVLKHIRN